MKIFVIKKNTIIRASVFVLLVAAAIVYTQLMAISVPTATTNSGLEPIRDFGDKNKEVAITIDTVFGDNYTDEILKVLEEKEVLATFFVTGAWAEQYPQEVKKILRAGHEIQNHSYFHKKYTEMSAQDVLTDANLASEILKNLSGQTPNLIRPPYGAYDDTVLQILYDNGYIPVKWSVDSKDWKNEGAKSIVSNVVGSAKNGSIIMFQNNIMDTPIALKEIIEKLSSDGYSFVTVTEGIEDMVKNTKE